MIEVDLNDTTENLKAQIQKREGIPVNQQRLVYAGLRLQDDNRLSDYSIKQECTVHMLA